MMWLVDALLEISGTAVPHAVSVLIVCIMVLYVENGSGIKLCVYVLYEIVVKLNGLVALHFKDVV